MAFIATSRQKAKVRWLLRELNADTRTITLDHVRRLGFPSSADGRDLDGWLDTLSLDEASTLIERLQGKLP